ncbi:MAG: PPC domain-containing DNA-binding protein [Peptoniphilaceae bacterium]
MEGKVIGNKGILRLDIGDEVISSISKFAKDNNISLASVSGIGASNDVKVGLFHTKTKEYEEKTFSGEDFEIVSLLGNITEKDDEPYIHLHITFGNMKGETFSGHLKSAIISVTGEIFFDIIDGKIDRQPNELNINIFKF